MNHTRPPTSIFKPNKKRTQFKKEDIKREAIIKSF